jgi:hypothetical protein
MSIIKFNPYSPWISDRLSPFFEDDDSWPQVKITEGLDVYEK